MKITGMPLPPAEQRERENERGVLCIACEGGRKRNKERRRGGGGLDNKTGKK